jgi:8-oxo-dGTP diphosphatase
LYIKISVLLLKKQPTSRSKMPSYTYNFPRPALTVDIVVFSIQDDRLYILLIQRGREPYRGKWALPGGFVHIEEGLMSAAARELEEETGLKNIQMEQLYTFGDPGRDPRGRVVSVAYFSLLKHDVNIQTTSGSDAAQARWFQLDELPPLAFDHDEIISVALVKLRSDSNNTVIGGSG